MIVNLLKSLPEDKGLASLTPEDISRYKGAWRLDRHRSDKEDANFITTANNVWKSIGTAIHEEDLIKETKDL